MSAEEFKRGTDGKSNGYLEHLLRHEREGDEFLVLIVGGDESWCL